MVALELRKDLVEEIRKISEEMGFINSDRKSVSLNVFEQNLPMKKSKAVGSEEQEDHSYEDEDDEEEYEESFPYLIVRLDSGSSQDGESEHLIKTIMTMGIWDDSLDANGSDTILNMFEKIRQRFRKNPVLNKQYVAADKITWALPDDDEATFPYFFGALEMNWNTAEIRREDPLA